VTKLHMFMIRAILGLFFAVIITRFFYGKLEPLYIAGLAILMVGLAYFAEFLRHRKER
jgi:hypothetical protein